MFVTNVRYALYKTTGLDKSSSDVAAEGAILNEMLDIVAKRAALRSFEGEGSAGHASGSADRDAESSSGGRRRPFESEVSGQLVAEMTKHAFCRKPSFQYGLLFLNISYRPCLTNCIMVVFVLTDDTDLSNNAASKHQCR